MSRSPTDAGLRARMLEAGMTYRVAHEPVDRVETVRYFPLKGRNVALGVAFCANIETIRQWLQSLMGWQLFPAEIYFLSRMPAKMDPVEVVYVVAMALGLSFLATLYPSWRAARLDPVEALRHE